MTLGPATGASLVSGDAFPSLKLASRPFGLTGVDAVGGHSGCTGDLHCSFLLMGRPKLGRARSNKRNISEGMLQQEGTALQES